MNYCKGNDGRNGDTLMIIGLGEIGGKALEILARRPCISRIVAANRNIEYGKQKVNNAVFGASLEGYYPNIVYTPIDLNNIEETAETIAKYNPTVIFNITTLQSYWMVELLPKEIHKKIQEISYGMWIPMHLTLCYKLMLAIEKSGINTMVVNGAYPDAVNPAISKVCQFPISGIGNGELVIPQIKKVVSEKLNVPMRSVSCLLVQHHYTEYWIVREGHEGGGRSYLKILVDGNDVTNEFDRENLWKDVIRLAKRPGRPDGHYIVASSAIQKMLAIYHDTNELSSCIAGPAGLLGGYPGRLGRKGFTMVLPDGISFEDAKKINEESSALEGIEKITEDGTIIFTEKNSSLMKQLIGYNCKSMKIQESEDWANELGKLYKEFSSKIIR